MELKILFIKNEIIFKLFFVIPEIIKLFINAKVPGFSNIGENNLSKKNLERNELYSHKVKSGNFFFD